MTRPWSAARTRDTWPCIRNPVPAAPSSRISLDGESGQRKQREPELAAHLQARTAHDNAKPVNLSPAASAPRALARTCRRRSISGASSSMTPSPTAQTWLRPTRSCHKLARRVAPPSPSHVSRARDLLRASTSVNRRETMLRASASFRAIARRCLRDETMNSPAMRIAVTPMSRIAGMLVSIAIG